MRWRRAVAVAAFALAGTFACGAGAEPAASAPGAIPFRQEPAVDGELGLRAVGALLVCLLVGGAAVYLLARRRGVDLAKPGSSRLQVLETRRLAPKAALILVRWDGEDVLLAQGEGRIDIVARKPRADQS